jgi:hypothetical protein
MASRFEHVTVLRQNVMGLNLAAMPVERPATDSGAPLQEHESGSNSEAVLANASFDQISNQDIRAELQRIGIGLSLPDEVWHCPRKRLL